MIIVSHFSDTARLYWMICWKWVQKSACTCTFVFMQVVCSYFHQGGYALPDVCLSVCLLAG